MDKERRNQPGPYIPQISLKMRIAAVMMAIVLVSITIQIFAARTFIENYITTNGSEKVLSIAKELAKDPDIISAFSASEPEYIIQPIVERVRLFTETSFIVVFNMDSVRYSHPAPSRIGKRFIGGDEERALKGETYISTAKGSLATSIRSFVPILNEKDVQIGVVSVGLNLDDLKEETKSITKVMYYIGIIALAIGIAGATILTYNIKKSIFGLEPAEIATLLEERDVIISSVMEGIVAVDRQGKLLLMNQSAHKLLSIEKDAEYSSLPTLASSIGLDAVEATGNSTIDEEMNLGGKTVVVNRIPMVSGGEIIGAVATLRDRSEMKLLAGELMAIKQYTAALRAQKHEFMNKLQVISGLLQIGHYAEALSYVKTSVSRQQQSVDTLRTAIEPVEVLALILAKTDEAHELGIEVQLEEGSHLPAVKSSTTAALITIIGNLLQNAIEALKTSNRAEKRIRLYFSLSGGMLEVVVEDNGKGIAPSLRKRLFAQGTSSKGEGHMGVGLYLVKKQVETLHGTIELQEKNGVKMIVQIPEAEL